MATDPAALLELLVELAPKLYPRTSAALRSRPRPVRDREAWLKQHQSSTSPAWKDAGFLTAEQEYLNKLLAVQKTAEHDGAWVVSGRIRARHDSRLHVYFPGEYHPVDRPEVLVEVESAAGTSCWSLAFGALAGLLPTLLVNR